jgi:predicted Zn finger-like uncharacterized protein
VPRHVSAALIFSSPSLRTTSNSKPIPFTCPTCEAEYKVVTIDVCDLQQGKIRCLKCDALFPAGEGRVAFKYFLMRRPGGHKRK